jgi:hypothetical protein
MMDLNDIRDAVGTAIAASVSDINCDGIDGAEVTKLKVSRNDLEKAAFQLAEHGHTELAVLSTIEIFVRISTSDVLASEQQMPFRIVLIAKANDIEATAMNEECWEQAWKWQWSRSRNLR